MIDSKKIKNAITLLHIAEILAQKSDQPVEICYSGGKDSDVILELAKMAGINYRAIYKNTTIDPPGTIKHCKENGVEILNPDIRFFELLRKSGLPTRRARFCCEIMKEYKVLDVSVQGIRKAESKKREKLYEEPVVCRAYGCKENHVDVFLPILEWTDEDLADFIAERGIQCHPLYYDEQGVFHVERRLGCIGCPLPNDRGLRSFKKYPKFVKLWVKAAQQFIDTHPDSESKKKFGDGASLFYHNVFCKSYEDFLYKTSTDLWGQEIDAKKALENFFNIKLD